MNWNIQTDLSLWLIPLGLGLAVFLSWLSYYTPKARQLFPEWARFTLITLRSTTLLFIFILFLGPRIISRVQTSLKPVFLIGIDNSSSMKNAISANQGKSYEEKIKGIISGLEDDYDVRTYLFGDRLVEGETPDYSHQATDFSLLFEGLAERHHADPVKGLLLISDGIFNQGVNPLYSDDIFPFPVHTMGMGDTTRVPDLRIREVVANELVYKDTRFPVEMIFDSWNLPDTMAQIRVSGRSGVILDTLAAFFPGENTGIVRFWISADEPGVQNFRISLEANPLEKNLNNNTQNLTVEVVENKAKILILYASPHPDVSAISSAIGEMEQYDLETSDIKTFTGRIKDYQLLIFHQLPARNIPGSTSVIQEFKREQVPALFIVGGQSDLNWINQLDRGARIDNSTGSLEDIQGYINENFSLFKTNDLLQQEIQGWPPLKGPLGNVSLSSRSEILLYQRIKSIQMDYPLMFFTRTRAGKNGFLLGEGIWRWRLTEYLESGSNEQLNTLVRSIIQYLVTDDARDQFRLEIPKTLAETEQLRVRAQVYNESYEPVPGMIVDFKLIDSVGQVSSFQMRPSHSGYALNLDPLKPGVYNYTAETTIGKEIFKKQGRVQVMDVKLEEMFTVADFETLEQMAIQKDGRFFTDSEYENLLSFTSDLEPGSESVVSESKWINLLQIKFLLFIIAFLLTLEWLLRRWFGTR